MVYNDVEILSQSCYEILVLMFVYNLQAYQMCTMTMNYYFEAWNIAKKSC